MTYVTTEGRLPMHRSRAARTVPASAAPGLSVPALVLVVLASASLACGLVAAVSVAAAAARKSPDAAVLVAHPTAGDGDAAWGRDCSNTPSTAEGSAPLRTGSCGSGSPGDAGPQSVGRLPAYRQGIGRAGPASQPPAPIFLPVLRI